MHFDWFIFIPLIMPFFVFPFILSMSIAQNNTCPQVMNNSTELQASLVTKKTNTNALVFLIILVLILCLHVAVQWCIYKARLHTNNYYLIRALSLADSLTIIWIIFFDILRFSGVSFNSHEILSIILSSFFHSSYAISLVITMLIVTDRWIAMQFALRYQVLVTKRKINIAILISSFVLVIIYVTLLFLKTDDQQKHPLIRSNQYILVFLAILRLITCIYIMVFAKLTIRIRNQNEARIQNITNFHGAEAERLDIIQRLTRSIKDVWKFNIWSCIFLVPTVVVLFINIGNFQILLFSTNVLYLISNPIVYLFCFNQVRQYWYRALFERNSVDNIDNT